MRPERGGALGLGGVLDIANAHVLPDDPTGANAQVMVVEVRKPGASGWESRPVALLGTDAPRDLTRLRMEGPPGPTAAVGDSSQVREGDALAFMGFLIGGASGLLHRDPSRHGLKHHGRVAAQPDRRSPERTGHQRSARGHLRHFSAGRHGLPGNSGGPLFDPGTGEVVGVMNMVLIKSTRESVMSQPSGISYAIPSRYVLELLARHR